MADAHKNFAYSTVLTAPSPATSGTSLVLASGDGALMPTVPFNATVWPTGSSPLSSNAEIVRVTAITSDTLTITRSQETSTARTVVVGDQFAATVTAKTLTDIENFSAPVYNVKGYGAKGDGTTDEYTAINSAVSALQTAGGGVLYFPAGTYVCSSTPTITGSKILIRGDGPDSIIKVAPSSMVSGGNTNGLWLNGAADIIIRDMCFDGNFAPGAFNIAYSGGWAMPSSVTGATFVTNTTQSGQNHTGTATAGTQETWVVTGDGSYPTGYPIVLKVGTATTGYEMIKVTAGVGTGTWTVIRGWQTTTQDKAAGSALQGMTLWDTTVTTYGMQSVKNYIFSVGMPGSTVDGNTYLNSGMPLRITSSSRVIVENCHIRNTRSSGLIVDGSYTSGIGLNMVGSFSTDIIIRGNECYNTFDNAIYLNVMCQNVSIIDNQTHDTQYSGIGAIGATRLLIAGNEVRNCGPSLSDSAGIEVGGVIRCVISGNLVENASFAGIFAENSLQGGSIPCSELVIDGNIVNACNHPLWSLSAGTCPGIQVVGSIGTRVSNNRVNSCDMGISISTQTMDTQVSNNTVRFSKGFGIFNGSSTVDDSVVGSVFTGNVVEYSGKHGIYDLAPAIWLGNTIAYAGYPNTGYNGMYIDAAPGGLGKKYTVVKGNVFSDASNNGIELDSGVQTGSVIAIHDNEFYNSDRQMYYDGVLTIAAGVVTLSSTGAVFTSGDIGTKISALTYDGEQTGTISAVSSGVATITGFGVVTNGHNVNPCPFILLTSRSYMVRGIFPDAANQTLEIIGNKFHNIAQAIYATNISATSIVKDNTETNMTSSATVSGQRVKTTVSSGASLTLTDPIQAPIQAITLTASTVTLTFPTAVAGNRLTLLLTQDATGSRAVTWPGTVKWPGGVTPAPSAVSGATTTWDFVSDGTNWYGSQAFPGQLQTTGNDAILTFPNGTFAFRAARATVWPDALDTSFFQVGGSNDNIFFSSQFGGQIGRLGFGVSGTTQIGRMSYSNAPTPTGTNLLEIISSTQTVVAAISNAGTMILGVAGTTLGTIGLSGSSSGTTTLQPAVAASGTLTLPAATDTLVGKATSDTLTNKTFDTAGTGNVLKINGTSITTVTGTGANVLATAPTINNPTFTGFGGVSSITADTASITTTETVVVSGTIPTPVVGTVYRITVVGTATSSASNNVTFTLRAGTAGTTSDASIASSTVTAAATGTNIGFKLEYLYTVRTTGSTGNGSGGAVITNTSTTGIATAAGNVKTLTTTSTFNTTTATKLTLTILTAASTTAVTATNAFVEIVKP